MGRLGFWEVHCITTSLNPKCARFEDDEDDEGRGNSGKEKKSKKARREEKKAKRKEDKMVSKPQTFFMNQEFIMMLFSKDVDTMQRKVSVYMHVL